MNSLTFSCSFSVGHRRGICAAPETGAEPRQLGHDRGRPEADVLHDCGLHVRAGGARAPV